MTRFLACLFLALPCLGFADDKKPEPKKPDSPLAEARQRWLRGNYEEADALFARAIADPFYATPAVAHANRGSCANLWGKNELAEQSFRKAVELDPAQPDALYHMADILFKRELRP